MMKSVLSILLVLSAAAACGSDDSPSPDASTQNNADAMPGGPDAMPSGPDAMPGAGIAYMEPCDVADDQCADELLCFAFNNKGPHCTHTCENDGDCESPSTGCNNMGVCKAP